MSELPALWPDLLEILNREGTLYLPLEVSEIIIRVIEIRRNIFLKSPDRFTDDYVEYDWDTDHEHPTQFWPNWEILCYPKKYNEQINLFTVRFSSVPNFPVGRRRNCEGVHSCLDLRTC